jgi:hypothetical protein
MASTGLGRLLAVACAIWNKARPGR